MSQYEDKVMGLVAQPDYKPITLKAMSRRFEVDADDYAEFRAAVKGLVKDGKLDVAKDKTLRKPERTQGPIIGALPALVEGLRVRPAAHVDRRRPTRSTSRPTPAATPRAATRWSSRSPSGRKRPGMNPEGRIVQVLARASGAVRRHLLRGRRAPATSRSTARRSTTRSTSATPAPRGPSPATRSPSRWSATRRPYLEGRGGHHRAPRPARPAGGRHPRRSSARSTSPTPSTTTSLDEAREQARQFSEDDVGDRLDLRDVAHRHHRPGHRPRLRRRDHACRATSEGYWSLGVHIADVSHFVRAGSALDRSARQRGTSVYLPDRVIPMLPEVLSNSLASLQAGRTPLHRQRPAGVQRRGRPHRPPVRPVGDPGRPPVHLRAGDGRDEATRRAEHEGVAPEVARDARRRCSSWR